MKYLYVGFLLFSFVLTSFAQETTPPKRFKRISWTPAKECLKANFSEADQANDVVVCDSFLQDGANVKVIRLNDIVLSVIIGDDGDYLLADTLIINNSKNRLLVNPDHASMFFWKNGDTKLNPELSSPIPAEKIAKKIRTRIAWANALGAMGASVATQTSTVNSTTNGTVSVIGSNGSSANGTYSGTTESTVTTPNTQAQVQEAMRARDRTTQANSVGGSYIASALKANTLFEKQSTNGLIYFKRTKAKFAIFTIELDNVLFDFAFTNPK